jgi:hypothetical protein
MSLPLADINYYFAFQKEIKQVCKSPKHLTTAFSLNKLKIERSVMVYKDKEKARACQRRYYERNRELYFLKNKRKKEQLRAIAQERKS